MCPRIHLSLAHMGDNEQQYIAEAFDTGWVAPAGPHIEAFEQALNLSLGEGRHTVALSSGTAALHLALAMLGVGPGDEVVCQSLTFVASANPILYLGARPVFVDSECDTWNISPELLEEAIADRKKQTGRYPKAIVAVDLYGMPAQWDEITAIAYKYGIPLVEDAAEALGAEYGGRKCGTFGKFGILSFNGNKMITTSGGGALICDSAQDAARARFLASQARENLPYYYHEHLGYNYCMSNICAGIGRGQMEVLARNVARRRAIHDLYEQGFSGIGGICVKRAPGDRYASTYWLSCITVNPRAADVTAEELWQVLEWADIESRLLWRPMHMQPLYASAPFYGNGVSEELYDRGLCLPSGSGLPDRQIAEVIATIRTLVEH